jgi:heme/copper-type cytochrome/quinol oxidase subunit 2
MIVKIIIIMMMMMIVVVVMMMMVMVIMIFCCVLYRQRFRSPRKTPERKRPFYLDRCVNLSVTYTQMLIKYALFRRFYSYLCTSHTVQPGIGKSTVASLAAKELGSYNRRCWVVVKRV